MEKKLKFFYHCRTAHAQSEQKWELSFSEAARKWDRLTGRGNDAMPDRPPAVHNLWMQDAMGELTPVGYRET